MFHFLLREIKLSVKHDDGSIMLCGCFLTGPGRLKEIQNKQKEIKPFRQPFFYFVFFFKETILSI